MRREKRSGSMIIWSASLIFISLLSARSDEPQPYELKYPPYFGGRFTIPEKNPMTKEGVALGRMLFYEKKLSVSNDFSCANCHKQKLAFTDGMAFSEGVDGTFTKRNSMSLVNLLWVRNLFWDGRVQSLEDQAVVPLTDPHEMGQALDVSAGKLSRSDQYPALFRNAFGTSIITGELIVKALAQFERTLISADSPYDRYLRGDYQPTPAELLGMTLFMTTPSPRNGIRGANCGHCHGTPKTFIELFHNNGLDTVPKDPGRADLTHNPIDHGRFRVPHLRNIALTAPYMHDGRFRTLEEVLSHYNEHIQQSETLSPFVSQASNEIGGTSLLLTDVEKKSIISFLHMLTDSTFITNPEFSDPAIFATKN